MARLRGINVLVTGMPAPLAQAAMGRLVAEGAHVIAGRPAEGADQDRAFGDSIATVDLAVGDPASWEAARDSIAADVGELHGLVNAAATMRTGSLTDMAAHDLEAMIETNLLGPALAIRTMAPLLRASGGGSIVNVASTEALRGSRNAAVFSATNWGLRGLTRSAALELGADGIRVNTVCPSVGLMSSGGVEPADDDSGTDAPADAGQLVDGPVPRDVTMGDVASMIVFLLSDDSATCTGGDFLVDAGATA